jgi:hypothetical protein
MAKRDGYALECSAGVTPIVSKMQYRTRINALNQDGALEQQPAQPTTSRNEASDYCLKAAQSKYPGVNIFHDNDASEFYYACLGSVWAHGIPKDEKDPRLELFGGKHPN